MVHCPMRVGTVRTCGKAFLWSRQPFCPPPTGLPELIIGLPMCGFELVGSYVLLWLVVTGGQVTK